jgi:hypothetical protein
MVVNSHERGMMKATLGTTLSTTALADKPPSDVVSR